MLIEFMRPNGFTPLVDSRMIWFIIFIIRLMTKIPIRSLFYQKVLFKKKSNP
jgi:hypothetical protein